MLKLWGKSHKQTLPNAQRTHGLSTLIKVTAFKSYHKLINIQLQNLDKALASKSWPNSSFNISTKLQPQNLDQTSPVPKSWPKVYLKSWPNFCFDIFWFKFRLQTSTMLQLQILYQTVINTCLSINISNTKKVLSWHLQRPESHQSSLLNRS